MDREMYQELVEHAYCNKALPVEAFDADAGEESVASMLMGGGVWSTRGDGAPQNALAQDFNKRISSAREAKNWSQQKLAEMLGVPKGMDNYQKKFVHGLESGDQKPTEEHVRKLEALLGIKLMLNPTENEPQKANIDTERRVKEHQILSDYGRMVADVRPQIQDILMDAVANNPYREALLTWREMENHARVIACCLHAETQQRVYVRYHPTDYSNHELQYRAFMTLMNETAKVYDLPLAELKALYARRSPPEDQKEGAEINLEDGLRWFEVNWRAVRQLIRGLDIEIAEGSFPPQPHEVSRLTSSHPLLAELTMRLQILQRKILHCGHCYKEYWSSNSWPVLADDADAEEKKEHYWVAVADKITRSVVETCVANAAVRSPSSVNFTDTTGAVRTVRIGKDGASDYEQALLKEAVLTGYAFRDELLVPVGDINSGTQWVASRKKQGDYSVNTALAPAVLQRLSNELRSFFPELAAFKSDASREDWCNTRAGQLLYAVQHAGFMFTIDQVPKQRITYADGSAPKHHTNMIRLTEAINEQIRSLFEDESGRNWLQDLLGRERLPPMVTTPLTRPLEAPDLGGYKTEGMQVKKPLISDQDGRQHLKRARFTPSNEAIEAINSLQRTKWRVDRYEAQNGQAPSSYDVVQQVLKHEIEENLLERLLIKKNDKGFHLEFTDSNKSVSRIRNGQIREWLDTFRFIDRLHEEFAGDPSFWHAWQFDWRGRMNPTTPMLSPQNDDVCRGLLRFAESVPLSEEGLRWLGRFTASLFRERSSTVEGLSNGRAYSALLKELDDRTWSSFDSVASNPLFLTMIEEILSLDLLEGFKIWGKGDVFRKKAEGFQRYSAMKEFQRVMKGGGVGVTSNLPVHLDASSSIYQHASALLRDKTMGQKVNVVAREDGMPADVYMHVSNALADIWRNNGFLKELDVSQATKDTIKERVLERSVAKGPVMTKGYGAGHRSMTYSLLTRNGDPDGLLGVYTDEGTEHDDEADQSPDDTGMELEIEETDEIELEGKRSFLVAHPESTLGFLHGLEDVLLTQHGDIASAVISGYTDAIKQVLPSFDEVLNLLKGLVGLNYLEPRLDAHLEHDAITKLLTQHLDVTPKKGLKWPKWDVKTTVTDEHELIETINQSLKPLEWSVRFETSKDKKKQTLTLLPRTERYNAVKHPLHWSLPDGDAGGRDAASNPAMATLLNREKEGGRLTKASETFTGASMIENWKWFDNYSVKVSPWKGARAHRAIARSHLEGHVPKQPIDFDAVIPSALTQPVDVNGLEAAFPKGTKGHQAVRSLAQIESERFSDLLRKLTSENILQAFSAETNDVDWSKLRQALSLTSGYDPVEYIELKGVQQGNQDARALLDFFFPYQRRISYQVTVHNRAVRKEKTGVAPNFIHSLDALHMRRFVRDMHRANHQDLWAVHDSFGCHANHVEEMRSILRLHFSAIHGLKSGADNVLLKTVGNVLNGLPLQKLETLSAQWNSTPPKTSAWEKGMESGLDALSVTKQIMGVPDIEDIRGLLGEMTAEDITSAYFVN